MTKQLDLAMDLVRRMPEDTQDAIARLVFELADMSGVEEIPAEHADAIAEGLAQADRGEFASDKEVEAAFKRFGR